MTSLSPDRSRDRRIEDPTNLWIIHPTAHALLRWFIAWGISANMVSIGGLALGSAAAMAYAHWDRWPFAALGLLLSVAWLIADGLDGMIARATGSASPLGRALDGLCDHGVFVLIYVALAISIGSAGAWLLAVTAGAAHALQSNLYESERARFRRRCKGLGAPQVEEPSRNPLVRFYDHVARELGRPADRFDAATAGCRASTALASAYGAAATPPMRLLSTRFSPLVWSVILAGSGGSSSVRSPRSYWRAWRGTVGSSAAWSPIFCNRQPTF
jgi:CDP-diacylglycerol---serine O-phosphatidyltransferase